MVSFIIFDTNITGSDSCVVFLCYIYHGPDYCSDPNALQALVLKTMWSKLALTS